MMMQRRLLDAVLLEMRHHRRNLCVEQNEITHRNRAVTYFLERDPRAERKWRLQSDSVDRHAQVATRHVVAMYVTGLNDTRSSHSGIDRLPVDR